MNHVEYIAWFIVQLYVSQHKHIYHITTRVWVTKWKVMEKGKGKGKGRKGDRSRGKKGEKREQ